MRERIAFNVPDFFSKTVYFAFSMAIADFAASSEDTVKSANPATPIDYPNWRREA
jgi:hypothetical protein